jgi:hypothetical protein
MHKLIGVGGGKAHNDDDGETMFIPSFPEF